MGNNGRKKRQTQRMLRFEHKDLLTPKKWKACMESAFIFNYRLWRDIPIGCSDGISLGPPRTWKWRVPFTFFPHSVVPGWSRELAPFISWSCGAGHPHSRRTGHHCAEKNSEGATALNQWTMRVFSQCKWPFTPLPAPCRGNTCKRRGADSME